MVWRLSFPCVIFPIMKVTFLGTGTSHGIPVIGCSCPVCRSTDPRDKRYRSSIMVEEGGRRIVIDTGYEFRLQMLREQVSSLDAVLYTHSHADHLSGIDDLRVFCQDGRFPIYSNQATADYIATHYSYAVKDDGFPGTPHFDSHVLEPYEEVTIAGFQITPIPLVHGRIQHLPVFGYRIGSRFAYLTDLSYVPDEVVDALQGVEVFVIGALREKPHGAHLNFSQAHEAALRIGAYETWFTHINHETSAEVIDSLYSDARCAYDGLVLMI